MVKKEEQSRLSPISLIQAAKVDLAAAKAAHLSTADEISRAQEVLDAGSPYWEKVDEHAFVSTYSGASTINFLAAMADQAKSMREDAEALAPSLNSTATTYGAITLNANQAVPVPGFDPQPLNTLVWKPDRDSEYVSKFEAFDPELGRLVRQIHQTQTRTTGHPAKSSAADVRQAYDHLIRVLVPKDDVVRQQPWWKPDPKNKKYPNQVTRRERYRYAAEQHIKNASERKTLLAAVDHAMKVYKELNAAFHDEKSIDSSRAQAAVNAMLTILYQWADALGL